MLNGRSKSQNARAKGFTLVELMLGVFLLMVVTGAVFEQIIQMQKKSNSEAIKVDQSQQARTFVDQTVRDLHMAGYPSASMYANQPDPTQIAIGLVSVSPTQILFEGDVDNDGIISSVNIFYTPNDPNDPNCPCVRRSVVQKLFPDSLNEGAGTTSTEMSHVVPPGVGPGLSGENLFEYFDQNGNPVNIGAGVDITTALGGDLQYGKETLAKIKAVKINVSLTTNLPDPVNQGLDRTSTSATVRLNQ